MGKNNINALMLVEDLNLFQDLFRSSVELLEDDIVTLKIHKFADSAEDEYKHLTKEDKENLIVFLDSIVALSYPNHLL